MRSTIIASAILVAVVAIPTAGRAQSTTHPVKVSLAAQAKISKDSAAKVALSQVANGTVKSSELEKEHGKLIYSFDITVPGQSGVEEVNVNALDGSVVAHEHESAAKESDEAKAEAKEAKAKSKSTTKPAAAKP